MVSEDPENGSSRLPPQTGTYRVETGHSATTLRVSLIARAELMAVASPFDRCVGHVYSTPDGGEAEVSTVTPDTDRSGLGWDDLVCRGPVVRWVRKGRHVPSRDSSAPTDLLEAFTAPPPWASASHLTLKAAFVPTQFEPQFEISITPDALARLEEENRAAREAGEREPYVFLRTP